MGRAALALVLLAAACAPAGQQGPATVGLVPLDASGRPLPAAASAGLPPGASGAPSGPKSPAPPTVRSPGPAANQGANPRAVPARSRGPSADVAAFALGAPNRVGQSVYVRDGAADPRSLPPDCGHYASDDLAQEAFLKAGGPQVDILGLDPDGDGFACGWDPARYRRALP